MSKLWLHCYSTGSSKIYLVPGAIVSRSWREPFKVKKIHSSVIEKKWKNNHKVTYQVREVWTIRIFSFCIDQRQNLRRTIQTMKLDFPTESIERLKCPEKSPQNFIPSFKSYISVYRGVYIVEERGSFSATGGIALVGRGNSDNGRRSAI